MKLELKRIFKGDTYTIGKLYIDGKYFCDTLEDAIRPFKIKNITAIPEGTYKVKITYSNRFKRLMLILLNVPNFEGIRIHSGNTDADTSGCILVGYNTVKGKLTNSKNAYDKLYALLQACKEELTIEVK